MQAATILDFQSKGSNRCMVVIGNHEKLANFPCNLMWKKYVICYWIILLLLWIDNTINSGYLMKKRAQGQLKYPPYQQN